LSYLFLTFILHLLNISGFVLVSNLIILPFSTLYNPFVAILRHRSFCAVEPKVQRRDSVLKVKKILQIFFIKNKRTKIKTKTENRKLKLLVLTYKKKLKR